MIIIKTEADIFYIRKACEVAAEVLDLAGKYIKAGISTKELDAFIEAEILKRKAKAAFKGYRGYRHASCLSINEEVVHGIPTDRIIKEGDIVGVDIGSIVNGYYGDVARTYSIGKPTKSVKKLLRTTAECLEIGIKNAKCGGTVGDISSSIEEHARKNGYSVVKDLYGHGVGKALHEDPLIPNFGRRGSGPKLQKGMVFAIEPMLNIGGSEIETLSDGWTVVTADRTLSAHFENTILITEADAEVLTKV